jgi:hypothetical protein
MGRTASRRNAVGTGQPALDRTVMSRSPSGNVLLRDGDGVLGTHRLRSVVVYDWHRDRGTRAMASGDVRR